MTADDVDPDDPPALDPPGVDPLVAGQAAAIDPTGTTLSGVLVAAVAGTVGAALARSLRRRRRRSP